MSAAVTLFEGARKQFGKDVFKLWPRISDVCEATLWHFNDLHGPLNPEQRTYLTTLFLIQMQDASSQPSPIASFQARMKLRRTDEDVLAALKDLRTPSSPVQFTEEILGRIGE